MGEVECVLDPWSSKLGDVEAGRLRSWAMLMATAATTAAAPSLSPSLSLSDGGVLGGAASTTSGHQPVMKYSVLHAQPVS